MRLSEFLLPEFDLEMAATRRHLERVPMDRLDFKPHDKSMTLGWLSSFLAILPTWGLLTLTQDSFDAAPQNAPSPDRKIFTSSGELLKTFDKNIADVRVALAAASDEQLLKNWTLLAGGKPVFSQPRFLVFRTCFLNHAIHHRAQLGMFLRLSGVAVPAVYNASADEAGGIFIDQETAAALGSR